MTHSEEFDLNKMDSAGYVPVRTMVGIAFEHFKGKVYTVRGFAWNGETDRWMLLHDRTGNEVMCARTPENFFAEVEGNDWKPRYKPTT